MLRYILHPNINISWQFNDWPNTKRFLLQIIEKFNFTNWNVKFL